MAMSYLLTYYTNPVISSTLETSTSTTSFNPLSTRIMVTLTASSVSSTSIGPATSNISLTSRSSPTSSVLPLSNTTPTSSIAPFSSTTPTSSTIPTLNSTSTSSLTPNSNSTPTTNSTPTSSTPPTLSSTPTLNSTYTTNSTTPSNLSITSDVSITTTTTSPNTATPSFTSTPFGSSSVTHNASSNSSTLRATTTTQFRPSTSSVSDSTSTPSILVTNTQPTTKPKTSGISSTLATTTTIKPVSVSGSSKKQQAQAPTSFRPSAKTSTTDGNKSQCPDPKLPAHGSITTNGPYLPNMSVTYTCLSGYTLSGPAQILCTLASKWSDNPPTCLLNDTPASMDTHIDLGNAGQVPVWLSIILGLTCGVLCLLLFTCVILYCLRVCGCRKEPIFSVGGLVSPGPIGDRGDKIRTDTNTNTRLSVVNLDQHQIQDNFQYKEPPKSNFETSQPAYSHRDQPHTRAYEVGQPVYSHQVQTTNSENGYAKRYQKKKFFIQNEMEMAHVDRRRQPAKKPSEKWMPHAQKHRDINTSTN